MHPRPPIEQSRSFATMLGRAGKLAQTLSAASVGRLWPASGQAAVLDAASSCSSIGSMRVAAAIEARGLIADHHHKYRDCDSGHEVSALGHAQSGEHGLSVQPWPSMLALECMPCSHIL